ncbi:MFS general substrate transporter [Aspergillus heteromorphus CBS 117.55]|uniref:MFS general substrate transporter n=1 Tax=Aspergillus heteromorphus CBS 117.55 TaxID=1448321 RepID=A0A317WN16_9EURO|nr:MFS general substrate transporter [Aspergillus heteromorphus CBS 117.55]PWY87425.1 MFS general substrate transporter [Aspergillus heteromorphus CBS 117.55]
MTAPEPQQSVTEETPLLEASIQGADNGEDSPRVRVTRFRGTAIVGAMGVLLFILTTNMSMMATAQSDIAADLDAFSETTWFNSAFLIAMSSITPLSGRLAQIFTPRVYILFSCTLLSVGLFVTATAPTLAIFLLGRVLTGCGAGGQMVIAIILALDLTSRNRRGLFIGMISAGMTVGVSSGAVLAGLLTPAYGWRSMFWLQAPAALLVGPVLFSAIPKRAEDENVDARALLGKLVKVDYAGALTLTLSVFLLLASLSASEIQTAPIIFSFIFLGIFLLIERSTTEPIIPIEVLSMRSVLLTCLSGVACMMARWSVLFYSPVYALVVRDWSPASAGLILVPTNAGFGLGGLLVGWVHIRGEGGYYLSALTSYLLFALSNLLLAILSTPTSSPLLYITATFFSGFSIGAIMNYALSHVLHLTSPEIHYVVSALIGMSRGFAGSFGAAIGGGFFQRTLKEGLETGFAEHDITGPGKEELVRKLLGSPALAKSLEGVERAVAVRSYEGAVKMLLLGSCMLTLLAAVAQAGTGWRGDRHKAGKRSRDEGLEGGAGEEE